MIPWLNTHTLAYLVWGLVNTGLIVQLGQQTQWGKQAELPMPVVAEQKPGTIAVETMPDYRLPALKKHFTETLTRPLFVSSRREAPPIPPPPPPPKPTMKKGQFQLLGTIITDDVIGAIVKEVSSGKIRQVQLTHTINSLRLDRVEPESVVFVQYEDSEELRLKIQPSPKPPTPVAQPGSPAQATAASAAQSAIQSALSRRRGNVVAPAGGAGEAP